MAKNAMFNRYAQNAKNANEKKMFNAKQARRNLDGDIKGDKEVERMIKLNDTFKGFNPAEAFKPKGG